MISAHSWTRLLAIASVALVVLAVPRRLAWASLVFSIGLGHYAMALWYSHRQLTSVVGRARTLIPFVFLVVAAALLYLGSFPLVFYFAIHHVFNEVYMVDKVQKRRDSTGFGFLRSSGVLLNLAIYAAILRDENALIVLDPRLYFVFLAVAVALFAVSLFYTRDRLPGTQILDNCMFEVVGLALVGLSLYVQITFLEVVLYHFIYWMLYPVPRLYTEGKLALVQYIGPTVVLTGMFLALSPLGWNHDKLHSSTFYAVFLLMSYVHITSSFALSDAQPVWIRRVFSLRSA